MSEIKVHGLAELERKLKALGKEVGGKNLLGKALRKGANLIRDDAKAHAPFDPKPDGIHVRDNIKVKRDPRPDLKGKSEIMYIKPFYTKKKNTWYWWLHEFGSAKTKGTKFMTKAFHRQKMAAIEAFKIYLAKQIKRAAKK